MPPYSTIKLHPDTHLPSSLQTDTYDVICIGSGWASGIIASRVVKAGMTAIIVEKELFGGDCPFWACVPSKMLLRPGEALDEAKAVNGVRERVDTKQGPDVEAVFRKRDEWTFDWQDGRTLIPMFEEAGVALVRGHGELVGVKQVKVSNTNGDTRVLSARQAVAVCTGSEAVIPKIPGLAEAKPWTPREATSTSQVPEHLVVMGAGAVGCEMVSAFAKFGGKVTLISSTAEILPTVDSEGGAIVRERFVQQGVDVHLSATVTKVQRKADNRLTIELAGKEAIEATELLVAVGRTARTANLGLEQFGQQSDGRPIDVDDSLRVRTVPEGWLFAPGDVNGRAPLSHFSKYHGKVVANSIIVMANKTGQQNDLSITVAAADGFAIPQVIFTQPAVASVGFTRKKAEKTGKKYREVTAEARSEGAMLKADGYEAGWAQWIVDGDTGALIGATFVGDNVAELLHASTVAIVGGMTLKQLVHAVPSFPTMSETYLNLLEAAGY